MKRAANFFEMEDFECTIEAKIFVNLRSFEEDLVQYLHTPMVINSLSLISGNGVQIAWRL